MKGLPVKIKAFLIPIIIFLVCGIMLIITILKQEQRLPSEGWSRGIDLNSTLSFNTDPLISKENETYHIYTKADNSVNETTLNPNFELVKRASIPVKIPDFTQFWTDGRQVAFVKNHQLIKLVKGKTSVLAQRVDGVTPFGNKLIYWKSNLLYVMNPTTQHIEKVVQTPYPIDSVIAKLNSGYVLVQSQKLQDKVVYLGLVPLKQDAHYHLVDRVPQTYNSILINLDFVNHNNILYAIYCKFGASHEGIYRYNYLSTYNLKTFKKQNDTSLINIIYNASYMPHDQTINLHINWISSGLALIFQGESTLFHGEDAQNIFLAKKRGDTWIAKPISSTVEPSSNPVWLTDHEVLWNDHIGSHYKLMIGSQNPQLLQQSEKLTSKDWWNAISRSLINMSISLLILAYALLWVIPTMVFLVGMSIGNITLMERNPYWVKLVGVLLFVIMELILIKGLFSPTFYLFSPSYLQFPGNWFILPILLAGISWFLTEWVKGKEWGNGLFIFYCLLIDVLMLGFLIGPYTL